MKRNGLFIILSLTLLVSVFLKVQIVYSENHLAQCSGSTNFLSPVSQLDETITIEPFYFYPQGNIWFEGSVTNTRENVFRNYIGDQFIARVVVVNQSSVNIPATNKIRNHISLPSGFYAPPQTVYWSAVNRSNGSVTNSGNYQIPYDVISPSSESHINRGIEIHYETRLTASPKYTPLAYANDINYLFTDNTFFNPKVFTLYLWGTGRTNHRTTTGKIFSFGSYSDMEAASSYRVSAPSRLPNWKFAGHKENNTGNLYGPNITPSTTIKNYRNDIDLYYEPNLDAATLTHSLRNLSRATGENFAGDKYEFTVRLTTDTNITENFNYPFRTTLPNNLRVALNSPVKVRRRTRTGAVVGTDQTYTTTNAANASSYLNRDYTGVGNGGYVEVTYRLETNNDSFAFPSEIINSQIYRTSVGRSTTIPLKTKVVEIFKSQDGKIIQTGKETSGAAGKTHTLTAPDLMPRWIYLGHKFRNGALIADNGTKRVSVKADKTNNAVEHIYRSNKATFTARFIDEDNQQIHPDYNYEAVVSDLLDLTKDTLLQEQLKNIENNYYQLDNPENYPTTVELAQGGTTITYKFYGKVAITEVQKQMNFTPGIISIGKQTLKYHEPQDFSLSLVDHRGVVHAEGPLQPLKRGQYQISLTMAKPFEGLQTGHQLATSVLTYYDKTTNKQKNILPNNQGVILVDQLTDAPQNQKKIKHIFTDISKDTKGFQLSIPKEANLQQDAYTTELTWNLVFGP